MSDTFRDHGTLHCPYILAHSISHQTQGHGSVGAGLRYWRSLLVSLRSALTGPSSVVGAATNSPTLAIQPEEGSPHWKYSMHIKLKLQLMPYWSNWGLLIHPHEGFLPSQVHRTGHIFVDTTGTSHSQGLIPSSLHGVCRFSPYGARLPFSTLPSSLSPGYAIQTSNSWF